MKHDWEILGPVSCAQMFAVATPVRKKHGMDPELIKAEMRIAGITPSALADEMGLSRTAVCAVIASRGASKRIQARIAGIIGKPVSVVWPQQDTGLRRTKVVAP